jgi:integrase
LNKSDLPSLNQESPIAFDTMTGKEDVIAHGFLSTETVDLLKVYLPTLERKNGDLYLFPSNGSSHISDEWLNRLLQRLAKKAKIERARTRFSITDSWMFVLELFFISLIDS